MIDLLSRSSFHLPSLSGLSGYHTSSLSTMSSLTFSSSSFPISECISKLALAMETAVIDDIFVCQNPHHITSKGVWNGDNPLSYATPLLILQFCLISVSIRTTAFCLRPLGQPMIVSQIIGGMILGPSVLGRDEKFMLKVFPTRGKMTINTLAWFGLMIYLFLEGVKMDIMIVKQSGRKAMAIGLSAFFLPLFLCTVAGFILKQYIPSDSHLMNSLPIIATLQSQPPFIVIACLLTELKTLNTDLGRLAVSSSVYADVTGISLHLIGFSILGSTDGRPMTALWGMLSAIAFVASIVFFIRPAMIWLSKHITEGKPVQEKHFCGVFLLMLVIGFLSLANGQNMVLGPLVLGLVVPEGPPLGSALVEKLDTVVSMIFLPSFFLMCGLHTDIFTIQHKVACIIGFLSLLGCLARMMAVMLSAYYYKIPMRDAMVLGFMLNSRGIIELVGLRLMNEGKALDVQEYTLTVISILVITAISAPLMRILYNPSQRYSSRERRTIQHMNRNSEFRMLVCISAQENVPAMINLIEVSHTTRENPISLIVLILVELAGRASPILFTHNDISQFHNGNSRYSFYSRFNKIFNAFTQYRLLINEDSISIEQFLAVSHVATMHDDVWQVARDKKANIIIIPFHKEWAIDGSISSVNSGLRAMNRKILQNAPCSVGVLIGRGLMQGSLSMVTGSRRSSLYRVTVLLLGGIDDGEALAYGARMALHEQVEVRVIHFVDDSNIHENQVSEENPILEREVKDQIEYIEEVVRDSERLASLIRDILEETNDLTVVGRHQWRNSRLFSGLREWNDCPELGVIGDMLASPDFRAKSSILVVQQHQQQYHLTSTQRSFSSVNDGVQTHQSARS